MAKQPPSGPSGKARTGIGPGAAGSGNSRDARGAPPAKASDARQTSLEAGRALQRLLDSAPAAQVSKTVDPATSKNAERALAMAASLEVHVPVGRVTDGDVERRIEDIRRTLSMVKPRGHGDHLQDGDEVLLDLLGYMGGDVFLAHTDTWYTLAPNKFLPGLFESLVGARVPDHRIVHVRLPDDYPVSLHAGRTAVFAVSIKQGRGRTLADPDDPTFLPFLNRGAKTMAELRVKLREEIVQERAHQMVEHAKLLLLRELYVKCMDDEVPDELVDEELTRRWREFQGEPLIRQGVSIDDQKKSQLAYAEDAINRSEARRTIWEYRILDAIAAHHGIEISDVQLKPVLVGIFGPDVEIDGLLYKNPGLHKDLIRGLRYKRATEVLLKKAKVYFDAPPTEPGQSYKPLVPARDRPKTEERLVFTAARGLARPPSKGPPKKS
jgi:trigger factor